MRTSSRGIVDPFIVMDVMEAARRAEAEGRHIIHMEVGQPSTPAPATALAALARAMPAGALGYTVSLGLPDLRSAIAGLYRRWYGLDLDPGRVVVTAGSSAAFLLAFTALFDAGDRVALGLPHPRSAIAGLYRRWSGLDLDPGRVVVTAGSSAAFLLAFTALFDAGDRVALGLPGYPSYRHILKALSLSPVGIETRAEDRYQPTVAGLPPDIAGLIVASPANPTGTMLSRDALAALIRAAATRGVAFVSDEIYHGLHYGDRAVSALEISDE